MQPLTTESAVRAAVVEAARGEIGYQVKVGGRNKYGVWYGPGWENAYFCAGGWSWAWNMALGEADARSVISHQSHGGNAPRQRGYIWTVAIIVQHRSKIVPLRNLKPGDAVMYRYNSGDNRQGNEVNHVDLVEVNNPAAGYVDCIGFNVPKPGATGGDPSRGGGVYRRRTYYNNSFVVAGIQFPAAAFAERARKEWGRIQDHLTDLGLASLQGTGTVGPATLAGIREYVKHYGYTGHVYDRTLLLNHLEATMTNILSELQAVRSSQKNHDRILNSHGQALGQIVSQTAKSWIADSVWQRTFYGFTAHWWLRRGGILDTGHRNFPADPGSPVYRELRREAMENNGRVNIYIPKGKGQMVTLVHNPETDVFEIQKEK